LCDTVIRASAIWVWRSEAGADLPVVDPIQGWIDIPHVGDGKFTFD
jgi:hypothetical protein